MLVVALALGEPGGVAQRARAEMRAGSENGVRMVGITDALRRPRHDLDIRAVASRSVHGVGPAPLGELAATAALSPLLWRAANELRPTAIVFHASTLGWPVLQACRRLRSRSVFVVHALIEDKLDHGANPYDPATTQLYRVANRHAARRSDRVVCVSAHIARVVRRMGVPEDHVRVLSNAISLDEFTPSTDAKTIDVLYVGRLSMEKGADILIRAAAGLNGLKIVIAGDGPERGGLQQLASRLQVDVEFAGSQSRPEVASLMRRSRLAVVPSRSEAQWIVVIEALACGLPVIGSRIGGIPELIDDGVTGWLVPPEDVEALRSTIVAALARPDALSEMGRAARSAGETYGPGGLVRAFSEIYLR